MDITTILTLLVPILAIAFGFYMLMNKLTEVIGLLKAIIDRQDRHKEGTDEVMKELRDHVGEERIGAAVNTKDHERVLGLLKELLKELKDTKR